MDEVHECLAAREPSPPENFKYCVKFFTRLAMQLKTFQGSEPENARAEHQKKIQSSLDQIAQNNLPEEVVWGIRYSPLLGKGNK